MDTAGAGCIHKVPRHARWELGGSDRRGGIRSLVGDHRVDGREGRAEGREEWKKRAGGCTGGGCMG